MDIKLINEFYEDGTLKEMFLGGFISSKVFEYREIYLWVDAQIKTRRILKSKGVNASAFVSIF